MKWQTCFNSECASGYNISMVKSAMQKFLRRRMPSEMKWCVQEMYKFKTMASSDKEIKIGRAIESNLKNRLVIMLDEELLFSEWPVYFKAKQLIEKCDLDSLYKVCDMLCEAKLLRYSSDVACYFIKAVLKKNPDCYYNIENISDIHLLFDKFKAAIENNFIEETFYWSHEIFINKNEVKLEKKVMKKSDPAYLIWDYLLTSDTVKSNENLRKSIEYRLAEYPKDRGEKKMFLVAALSLYMYRSKINWNTEWEESKSANQYALIEGKLVIPDYAIDMHCQAGRLLGKNQEDFAKEGSLVVNEDKEYYNPGYRSFYNKCKIEDATSNIKKIKKVKQEKNKIIKDKILKKKIIIEEDEEENVIIKRVKKYVAKLPEKDALQFIKMDDMKLVKLCLTNPCGKKVMCFVVEYQGNEYVLKEGRKSMNYNEDYEVVDHLKEIFGLNNIGMRRIFSDKIMEKVDKTKKEWTDNWHFVERDNVVYSMMSYIKGTKFNKAEKITREMEIEYMKIGLFRGIPMVSDFNVTNVFVIGDKLYSIDEHDILGKREKMIGEKNMRFYKKNCDIIDNIFADLYENKEEKKVQIVDVLKNFKYDQFIEKVLENYDTLRERFYVEYNA